MPQRGLAYWNHAVEDPVRFFGAIEEMRRHPRFVEAARRSLANARARHDQRGLADFTSQDAIRLYYAVFVLYLDIKGGVTTSAIQKLCADIGLSSPGRASAILGHLQAIGYVELDSVQKDRRSRRYRPTRAMRENFLNEQRRELRVLALIEPEAQTVIDRIDEPEIFSALITNLGEGAISLVKSSMQNALTIFSERNAGLSILFEIMATAGEDDTFPPEGPLRVSLAGLAKRFHVSRAHVFKLFTDAEREGLVRRDSTRGLAWIEAPLRLQTAYFVGALLVGLAACCYRALAAAETAAEGDAP